MLHANFPHYLTFTLNWWTTYFNFLTKHLLTELPDRETCHQSLVEEVAQKREVQRVLVLALRSRDSAPPISGYDVARFADLRHEGTRRFHNNCYYKSMGAGFVQLCYTWLMYTFLLMYRLPRGGEGTVVSLLRLLIEAFCPGRPK